jgi:hypothetical protein
MQAFAGYISYMERYFRGVIFGMTILAPRERPGSLPEFVFKVASAVVLGMFADGW